MKFFKRRNPKYRLKDLNNNEITIQCGENSFIDPEAIFDSPDLITIGSNTIIRKGVVLRPEGGEIFIGNNCVINHYSVFHGRGSICVGDWTIIGPHCGFYAQNHSFNRFDIPITKQKNDGKGIYLMGDNWIGAHAVILDDVSVGKGAVIGANSTVTKSVPMASVAVGSPAIVTRKRHLGAWDFQKVERASYEGMPDYIQEHVNKRGELIKEIINTDDNILDVGCGEGIVTSIVAEKNKKIAGCDYSLDSLELAKKKYPNIKFVYSNSTNLKFQDAIFTKVILSDIAEHLLRIQLLRTLDEIERVLKNNGILILATPLTGNGKKTTTYAHIYEYGENEISSILSNKFANVRIINRDFGIFIAQKK